MAATTSPGARKQSTYNLGKRWTMLSTIALLGLLPIASAALIPFENCLDQSVITPQAGGLKLLQFVPTFVDARFNASSEKHTLNITVYGNVTGQTNTEPLPSFMNTTYWNSPNMTEGKLVNVSSTNTYTTLDTAIKVLSYTPYQQAAPLCDAIVGGTSCPIAPVFDGNASNPHSFRSFSISNDFFNSYSFATFASTLSIRSGEQTKSLLGCVSANITPDLGQNLRNALTWLPAAILILVGVATLAAARFSPWSPKDPFHWTSNYVRDEDLIRLMTPGFGDCLQYIQFIVLTGALTLDYPGYYQPVISQASWSVLMFNSSFVSANTTTTTGLVDGIYVADAPLGMSRLAQIVGLGMPKDVWACMAIWLACITGVVILLCQIGFFSRWISRRLSHATVEDLTQKNFPFTFGNINRLVFGYFLLPIISFSTYQFVIAGISPAALVAVAVVFLAFVVSGIFWIARVILATRPRANLFDDLRTMLLYGPIYNTFVDSEVPYAIVPLVLTLLRGIAIGAVQQSGIAQLILLCICEIILILTLHAFRPFANRTSMNAYHTFFASVRLATILLSIAFVPSLGVNEGSKGWLGYAILLLHAIVLVFGFFLNALQTMIEIAALTGRRGAEERRGGLAKVFGMRQLSRRARRHGNHRSSIEPPIMENEMKDVRTRSMSASSTILLSKDHRASTGYASTNTGEFSAGTSVVGTTPGVYGHGAHSPGFTPLGVGSRIQRVSTGGRVSIHEPVDPYYRPPRSRGLTMEDKLSPGRLSGASPEGEFATPYMDSPELNQTTAGADSGEGSSAKPPVGVGHRVSVAGSHTQNMPTAYFRDEDFLAGPTTDYAVRESDFYYGVRGPALSSNPSRRRKTGPADPMSSGANVGSWFKKMIGGKTKEKGKGFEVVRSTRAPPQGLGLLDEEDGVGLAQPYRDAPDAGSPTERDTSRAFDGTGMVRSESNQSHGHQRNTSRPLNDTAPSLSDIRPGFTLNLPSRMTSNASTNVSTVPPVTLPLQSIQEPATRVTRPAPTIPRRSSRRSPSGERSAMGSQYPPGYHRSRSNTGASSNSPPMSRSASQQTATQSQATQATEGASQGPNYAAQAMRRQSTRKSIGSSVYTDNDRSDDESEYHTGFDMNGFALTPKSSVRRPKFDPSASRKPSFPFPQYTSKSATQPTPQPPHPEPISTSFGAPHSSNSPATGSVQHHLASDSIHPAFRDQWAGREAEVVFGGNSPVSPIEGLKSQQGSHKTHKASKESIGSNASERSVREVIDLRDDVKAGGVAKSGFI